MKISTCALAGLAIPAFAEGYSFGPFYNLPVRGLARGSAFRKGSRCSPDGFGLISPTDVLAARAYARDSFKKAFRGVSPAYQVIDNDEMFQVQIDVPGVEAKNLKIDLEENGKVLTLSGSREKVKDGYSYSSKFSESFYLDPTVDADKFTANLQNGVLTVSAPKEMSRIADTVKSIPVTEIDDGVVGAGTKSADDAAEMVDKASDEAKPEAQPETESSEGGDPDEIDLDAK